MVIGEVIGEVVVVVGRVVIGEVGDVVVGVVVVVVGLVSKSFTDPEVSILPVEIFKGVLTIAPLTHPPVCTLTLIL